MTPPMKKRKIDNFSDVIKRGFLTESNVGVTEFIGKQRPFIGILKHRFEDFVVHEIDKSGTIVELTENDEPEDLPLEEEESEAIIDVDELKIDVKIVDEIRAYSEKREEAVRRDPISISVSDFDKAERTKIHAYVRQNFDNLDTKTESIDGKPFIKVLLDDDDDRSNDNARRRRGRKAEKRHGDNRSQRRLRWPSSRPSYVHFVLYKENMETVQVVNELSRRLACTPKNFTFAGTKDKRAITTQRFAAWKTSPRRIWSAVQEFNRRSRMQIELHVGHFAYEREPLKLGDLRGNRFEILLRNIRFAEHDVAESGMKANNVVEEEEEEVEGKKQQQQRKDEKNNNDEKQLTETFVTLRDNVDAALRSVRDIGFINYFGMQRFGSHRIDSHKLGVHILKRDFRRLVHEILVEKPIDIRPGGGGGKRRGDDRSEISFNDAIRIWRESGDAALAYKRMNYKYTIEGSLLRALSRVDPNDYHGALCIGLLRNSRLLYLHAYQSYVWNRVASYRIRRYGLAVVEGDLVLIDEDDDVGDGDDADDLTILPPTDELDQQIGNNENNQADDNEHDDDDDEDKQSSNETIEAPPKSTTVKNIKSNIAPDRIVHVTSQNIAQHTIYDVVLPIIGGMSKLPRNEIGDYIRQILSEDGVTIDDFASLSKQWCVNGSYRRIVVRPAGDDFRWCWRRAPDQTTPLIETDLDRIHKRTDKRNGPAAEVTEKKDEKDEMERNCNALKISVTLPTSSYATVLLREVTKLSSLALENKPWQQQPQQQQQHQQRQNIKSDTLIEPKSDPIEKSPPTATTTTTSETIDQANL